MGPCIGKDPLVSSIRKVHPSSPRICEHSNVISVNYRKIPNKFKQIKQNLLYIDGLVGLSNLGNTCYINSALQCLSNTQPLADYFHSKIHIQEINLDNPLSSKGQLTKAYAELLDQLWCALNKKVEPRVFLNKLFQWNPNFSMHTQEDSHEFLAYFLDIMHEDLNRVKKKPYFEESTFQKNPTPQQGNEAWQNYLKRNRSIIVDLFQGQQKNMLKCQVCGYESHKFETFMYLSLPIPENTTISLAQCIQNYQNEEILDKENCWMCPKCKEFQKSKKNMTLWKLPNILVIHLKRFKFTASYRCKIRQMVEFPISDLNLDQFISLPQQASYDLYAVINHSGTLSKGHYTSFCKNRDNQKWYQFDDSRVNEIKIKDVVNNDAYLLFYHKNNVDAFDRQSEVMKSSMNASQLLNNLKKRNHVAESKKRLKSCVLVINESIQNISPAQVLGKKRSFKHLKLTPTIDTQKGGSKFFFPQNEKFDQLS